jgi:hypothetical protein
MKILMEWHQCCKFLVFKVSLIMFTIDNCRAIQTACMPINGILLQTFLLRALFEIFCDSKMSSLSSGLVSKCPREIQKKYNAPRWLWTASESSPWNA